MTGSPHPPPPERAAARIPPPSPGWAGLSLWLGSPKTWIALVAGSGLLCAVIYFGLVRRYRPHRPRASWAARPQLDGAIAAAQLKLQANPQDIAALAELGMLHFEQGAQSYPDAVNELEEARRLGSLDDRLFYSLGRMYQDLGLFPFALDEYQKHLRNHPDDKEVRMLAAKLYYRQGDFPAAIKEFERLRFHDPEDLLIAENLGLSLWGAKLMDRAVENFQQLKAAGGLPARRADFYLGQIAFEAGRVQEAADLLRRSLPEEGEPDFGIPRDRMFAAMAMAWQRLNRPDEAREAWQRVLLAAPNDAKAQAALRDLNRRFPPKKSKKR